MTTASRPLILLRRSIGSTPKKTRRLPVKANMLEWAGSCIARGAFARLACTVDCSGAETESELKGAIHER
jgi:hypothetical protein